DTQVALSKAEPVNTTFLPYAWLKSAPLKLSNSRFALCKLLFRKLALTNVERRITAFSILAPAKLELFIFELLIYTPFKLTSRRSWLLKSILDKLHPL